MFRATNLPIFRGTFDCIYSSTLLLTSDAVEMELQFHLISTVSPISSSVGALYQKLYIQSKVLLTMGEFVARNM
jgi:hypothetical protein